MNLCLPADFPMTPEEVYVYREKRGKPTPLGPVVKGAKRLWLCFASRGTYEFFVHPDEAEFFLEHGMFLENKQLPVKLSSTPYYPWIGAVQIVVKDNTIDTGFIDASKS